MHAPTILFIMLFLCITASVPFYFKPSIHFCRSASEMPTNNLIFFIGSTNLSYKILSVQAFSSD